MHIHPVILLVVINIVIFTFLFLPVGHIRKVLTILLLSVIGYFLVITVAEMPPFGDLANPANNEVPARYLEKAVEDTGAVNVISSIIVDYRALDTLGEATVLFIAIAAMIATLKSH